jgi:hypothetical protein
MLPEGEIKRGSSCCGGGREHSGGIWLKHQTDFIKLLKKYYPNLQSLKNRILNF